MTFEPLNDYVLIEPLESDEKTAGGIFLPDAARERPTQGLIVAVGPGSPLDDGSRSPMPVAEGDAVVYNLYAGTDVTLDGTDYKVLHASEILARMEAQ